MPRQSSIKTKLVGWLLIAPWGRAIVPNLLIILIGIFSGTLVTEISSPTGLVWRDLPKTVSLYVLLSLSILQVWYTRALFLYERELMRFLDNDYCVAYMRSVCLPELATKAQERIRNGQGGEFKDAMDEVKKTLGIE